MQEGIEIIIAAKIKVHWFLKCIQKGRFLKRSLKNKTK